jgi:acetyl-CoA synthetase
MPLNVVVLHKGDNSMQVINPIVRRWRDEGEQDPEGYWERAALRLPWFQSWSKVFEHTPPTYRWFVDAKTNLSYNCLDVHVAKGWGGHAALIALNERGERATYTYAQFLEMVKEVAAGLRGLGVKRGDRVAIYMPTCAEAIALMLACTRIGAIHIVIFAGFGSGALAERVQLSGAKILFASDITYRMGKDVPLKGIADEAVAKVGKQVERVVVHRRGASEPHMVPVRDITWQEFLAGAKGQSSAYEVMEANEPAYILATSGTTARPKLAVHNHGAYQVGIYTSGKVCFGMKPEDVWWSTSDIGWVVGHSYIVYAPLLFGCTTIAYEGGLVHPGPEHFYQIIEREHVTGIFTSPTAARLLFRYGEAPAEGCDLSSLERVVCAGEPLNPPAWEWLQLKVLKNHVPVIDHYWQTETGGPVLGNPYGLAMLPIKPGSACLPMPGISVSVVTPEGEPCAPNEQGVVVITRPFPGLTQSLWGEPERYASDYWARIPGTYFTGDAGLVDEDGYFWVKGRSDEIIKIAGHRIGTIEVETALLRHPAVAEAGVTGRPDELRGEVVSAFVALRAGYSPSEAMTKELLATIREEMGPVVVVGELNYVRMLPKTRSGKIMRRVLKAVILNRDPGDISTIEDEGSVEEAREAWQHMRSEMR